MIKSSLQRNTHESVIYLLAFVCVRCLQLKVTHQNLLLTEKELLFWHNQYYLHANTNSQSDLR